MDVRSRAPRIPPFIISSILAAIVVVAGCTGAASPTQPLVPTEGATAPPTGAAATAVPAETISLTWGHILPETDARHRHYAETAERIEQRSNGTIDITLFCCGQLGGDTDMVEQGLLGQDVLVGMDPGMASNQGGAPEFSILNGAFLFDTYDQMRSFLDTDLFESWTKKVREESGLVSLAWNWYFGERHILSKEGYPDPSDLAGVLMRVPPSPTQIELFTALNASPVTMEFAEVYNGLDQGVVEAVEAPLSTLHGFSLYEVANVITLTGHIKATTGVLIPERLWEQLSPEQQTIMREEFQAGGERYAQETLTNDEKFRALLEEEGVTFVEADIDAYREASVGFYDAFPQWPEGLRESILEEIQN